MIQVCPQTIGKELDSYPYLHCYNTYPYLHYYIAVTTGQVGVHQVAHHALVNTMP